MKMKFRFFFILNIIIFNLVIVNYLTLIHAAEPGSVTPEFAALGSMYEFQGPSGPLVLSGVAKDENGKNISMSQERAIAYCRSLGGGARLPDQVEFLALAHSMGAIQPDQKLLDYNLDGYRREVVSGMYGQFWSFWSSTLCSDCDYEAFAFNAYQGELVIGDRSRNRWVRCVCSY